MSRYVIQIPVERVRLDSLFDMINGVPSSQVHREPLRLNDNYVPFIRPSYRQNSSVDSYVNRYLTDESRIFPAHTLYVSTDGQGSHSYAYVSAGEFVPNSNVTVLIPRREMTLREKLFYAMCITRNRFKFSYGRKPKGERLGRISLPARMPESLEGVALHMSAQISDINRRGTHPASGGKLLLSQLFRVVNGLSSDKVLRNSVKRNENWIPYIRPSYRQTSSIDAYVNRHMVDEKHIFPAHTLYVSTDGQGSHTYAYVSAGEFVPNSNVAVLIPRREMTLREKLFYAMCITRNRFKFSYGRKPKGERLENLLLPDGIPARFNEPDIGELVNSLETSL